MGKITVVGAGWTQGELTLNAVEALKRSDAIVLHTDRCGCADWLKQNGIPYLVRRTLGAGLSMSVGAMMECHRIYVPFAELDRSLAIVDELFPGDEGDEWSFIDENEASKEASVSEKE